MDFDDLNVNEKVIKKLIDMRDDSNDSPIDQLKVDLLQGIIELKVNFKSLLSTSLDSSNNLVICILFLNIDGLIL